MVAQAVPGNATLYNKTTVQDVTCHNLHGRAIKGSSCVFLILTDPIIYFLQGPAKLRAAVQVEHRAGSQIAA